ncbi:cytochrome c1 [Pelagibacteraceae bacterium]|jgi:ubiquinol-cytochrome c reductase cytochrome c1 subunit|nr:cytochrome c1 [Pelagibacteraceae bacterium]|tara:strand:+ start:46 stop:828 length:783 start_codon:yes stop_codon:yes gene_type:complete
MKKNNLIKLLAIILITSSFCGKAYSASKDLLKIDWSFAGITGKFERDSLQRGYQVYKEVCASCHSMQYLSYRNLSQKGGPEFTLAEAKAIAASYEVEDGPNTDGDMFTRPGRPSDHFVSPYPNVNAATAANGGAYPPDMSVLVKARPGGANYIYSVLMGYEEKPIDFILEDGVYYNKYMDGNKIKMPNPLSDDLIEYSDGTNASQLQMAKDVTAFLTWAAEPHLEARHKTGTKVIIYLILLATLVYFSMKRLWSGINTEE